MRRFIPALFALSLCAQEIPRPEYPQPQFQRELWQSLNGAWEFEFDDANAGLNANWAAGQRKFSKSIAVPFAFETKKSGIGDTSFHPWVWYRRIVTLPTAWKGRRVLLHFGAVDYRARVWVNGKEAGQHEGGGTPFWFDVTPLLAAGANTITVRAEDPPQDRFIPRGKQYWELKSRSIFYTRTSGIWQSVWLEATGDSYLESVRITPSNDGAVKFDAKVRNAEPGLELHATIKSGPETVAAGMSRSVLDAVTASAFVRAPKLWSVNQPNLYDVTFELRKGATVLDRVQSYFGFRTVTLRENRVFLNDRPVYLKFVLDQGYWPESTLTPPSDEAIQYDIRMTKEMGFNGARKHQKIEDPRFHYWADKMGFLVSGEIANAYEYDEAYVARFTREWMEAVERDYNHPSVIMWVPINESWGVPDVTDSRQVAHLRANYFLTKSMDPTRLVIDNDGWEHTDMTDLFAFHDYARDGGTLLAKYKEAGTGPDFPPNGRRALVPGFKYNGSPLYLSEFGGISYIAAGSDVPVDSWGYAGVEKSKESAFVRLAQLYYSGILQLPRIIGICYTQITDVEQEINGLMTYDRKPKFDVKKIKELNDFLR
jgi:beta-galactosidase/beta-glucuronidase